MRKHFLRICISSCAFFFALAIGCFTYFSNTNHSYAYDILIDEGQQVKDTYEYGSSFLVPSASFKVDGQEIPASDHYVIYPNGIIYTSDSIMLTVEGEYTIVYSTVIDGKKIEDESVKFKVYNNAWKFNYDTTTVEYNDGKTVSGKDKDGNEVVGLFHKPNSSGLHLSLADGDTWTYNRVIDLSDNTDIEPLLEFSPWNCSGKVTKTLEDGTVVTREVDPEATNIYVRLTDCYDPENYLNIRMHYYKLSAERYQIYTTVASPGIDTIGLRSSESGKIIINNVSHNIVRNSSNRGSYSGDGFRTARGAKLYYDNESKVISFFDGQTLLYVTDLDDKNIYYNNMFKGFATGEVILSVYYSRCFYRPSQ